MSATTGPLLHEPGPGDPSQSTVSTENPPHPNPPPKGEGAATPSLSWTRQLSGRVSPVGVNHADLDSVADLQLIMYPLKRLLPRDAGDMKIGLRWTSLRLTQSAAAPG